MRSLEELTWWQRGLLLIVIIAIITLAILILQAESEPALPPRVPPWDTRILELDLEALDRAYIENSVRLFSVWMKDEHDQPRRMLTGLTRARKAYSEARDGIEAHKRDIDGSGK